MSDAERGAMRDAGRDEGGRHYGTRPIICEVCGSPDVREVEVVARSSETVPSERLSLRCVDCGAEQV